TYLEVVRGKTAALFAAACEVGGVIAGAPESQVDALRTYGDALGVAFQITDDLLDYGGLASALGKNVGDDFRERKLTLPVIRAVAAATPAERDFWARAIGRGQQRPGDLEEALRLMARHGALVATHAAAEAHAARARAALAALPDGPLHGQLDALVGFVVARAA
ncbi:MAG TPA: polyprenyl synthetase family protein, partial [Amaricoccus sp.]|nr:polyprenyl synthetase family protein [Amaricoccus sp.]